MSSDWKNRFEQEIRQAEAARADGGEGRARVCARRAAGIVAGEYLLHHGIQQPGPSAYDRLRRLSALPSVSPKVREIAGHFLVRIDPDWKLPIQADLIAEARWLAKELIERNET